MSGWDGPHLVDRERFPSAVWAQHLVRRALTLGLLKRKLDCEECGKGDPNINGSFHAHHLNYSRPFDVVWVCMSCHKKIHLADEEKDWGTLPREVYDRLRRTLNDYARKMREKEDGQSPSRKPVTYFCMFSQREVISHLFSKRG